MCKDCQTVESCEGRGRQEKAIDLSVTLQFNLMPDRANGHRLWLLTNSLTISNRAVKRGAKDTAMIDGRTVVRNKLKVICSTLESSSHSPDSDMSPPAQEPLPRSLADGGTTVDLWSFINKVTGWEQTNDIFSRYQLAWLAEGPQMNSSAPRDWVAFAPLQ
jgi:hypothetical protein